MTSTRQEEGSKRQRKHSTAQHSTSTATALVMPYQRVGREDDPTHGSQPAGRPSIPKGMRLSLALGTVEEGDLSGHEDECDELKASTTRDKNKKLLKNYLHCCPLLAL